MNNFKSYHSFNESMENIFRSSHAAIDKKNLVPLTDVLGKPKMPTQKEFDAAVDFMDIDPDFVFYNKNDFLHPFIYWKGPLFFGFFGGLNMEALKMMRADSYIDQQKKMVDSMLKTKNYEGLFNRIEKKILIPTFIDMYEEIPDAQKYDVFTDLYVRSEYGFQIFPIDLILDCFSKRHLSADWKKRMEKFIKKVGKNDIEIFRGENLGSSKEDDAFSWSLSKKLPSSLQKGLTSLPGK